MIRNDKQAKAIQARRVSANKAGVAKAVRRYLIRKYWEEGTIVSNGRTRRRFNVSKYMQAYYDLRRLGRADVDERTP